jgi:phosphatidylglycerol---prolipoprotein diacylglyceryl transferase
MNLIWDADPILFAVGGVNVGWYGVMFALGFFLSHQIGHLFYSRERKIGLDVLLLYLMVGCIVGARLAHCAFYDPGYYISHPLSILKVWEGGLASHGAALGMILSLYVFSRRHPDHPFLWLVDRIAIVALMTGALVRTGNFINGEIIGTPTNCGYGVVFVTPCRAAVLAQFPAVREFRAVRRVADRPVPPGQIPVTIVLEAAFPGMPSGTALRDLTERVLPGITATRVVRETFAGLADGGPPPVLTPVGGGWRIEIPAWGIARHPVQLYEGASALFLAVPLFIVWWRRKGATPGGLLLGWCFIVLFTLRFFLEYVKADVTPLEAGLPLKIGQILSLPCVAFGLWLVARARAPETTSVSSP